MEIISGIWHNKKGKFKTDKIFKIMLIILSKNHIPSKRPLCNAVGSHYSLLKLHIK